MASTSQAVAARPTHAITGRNGLVDKYFYFAMSLLAVALVIAGFDRHGQREPPARRRTSPCHPLGPCRSLLHLGTFLRPSVGARAHAQRPRASISRSFGAALGVFMVPLGLTTAVIMARFKFHQLHQADAALFLSVPFLDITCFATFFTLAVYWRKKPELHRRFIFLATSVLLAASRRTTTLSGPQ